MSDNPDTDLRFKLLHEHSTSRVSTRFASRYTVPPKAVRGPGRVPAPPPAGWRGRRRKTTRRSRSCARPPTSKTARTSIRSRPDRSCRRTSSSPTCSPSWGSPPRHWPSTRRRWREPGRSGELEERLHGGIDADVGIVLENDGQPVAVGAREAFEPPLIGRPDHCISHAAPRAPFRMTGNPGAS